jgi:putative acetyltransferase
MHLRAVATGDAAAIGALVAAAFGRTDEAVLVERLRAEGEVIFELVAEEPGAIVGHVLFSRLQAGEGRGIAALAPLAVRADRRRRGLGADLCEAAIEEARRRGLEAILVLGDPAYYGRFGFSHAAARQVSSPYSAHPAFQALALKRGVLDQPLAVTYAAAFG